jgi:NTE family protein
MTSYSRATTEKAPGSKNSTEFESIALLFQGGGALGAYQAGVYEALAEADIIPDWVGGISIGAINGAIIAGNKRADRVERLRGFWEAMTANPIWGQYNSFSPFMMLGGDAVRSLWNGMSASSTVALGIQGFFKPHVLPSWFVPPDSLSAISFYDTGELHKTLKQFIDFDILNSGATRFTISAVNVSTGNYTIFDTSSHNIGPEHIMASCALPPGLPAVEIEDQYYWDGGLISNTPLEWVMNKPTGNTLVFQVDLWSAEGDFPKDILEVMTRGKEIQYSSRTRAMTTVFRQLHKYRNTFASLYNKLPPELKESKEAQELARDCGANLFNIVHLIYRTRDYEGCSKDFEFSRQSMEEHWEAGHEDTVRSLNHKDVLKLPSRAEGIMTYDLTRPAT